jgi:DNA-binding MarR family transcriptional regulator
MMSANDPDRLLHVLRETIISTVRHDGVDLTARQFAVFLTSYLTEGPHTVRGLAAELNVPRPAITRALDQLGEVGLTRRAPNPLDRRSVHVQQTATGRTYLRDLTATMTAAMHGVEPRAAAAA